VTGITARLHRDEAGFTLPELLVACLVGTVILLATFTMLDTSVVLTGRVTDRVDRTARARTAMEAITRELRSQVCPAAGTPAVIDGENYSVKFYAFMGSGAFVPDIHEIAWDTNTNSITDKLYQGSGTSPFTTWPSSPTKTSTILTDVKPPPANAPMFAYYAAGAATPFAVPVSGTSATNTAKVTINFMTYAQSKNLTGTAITLQNEVFARTADPNTALASPNCA
jgi:prepilin-type N-terminal cleavage/methylation domain-containing protein